MKKVLITGISGFAGSFLAEHLLSKGEYDIVGTTISETSPNLSKIISKIKLVPLDLMESEKVEKFISEIRPDFVYHLAALTAPGESFINPSYTINNNISAQINIFEGLRKNSLIETKCLITSSADIYGVVDKGDLPMDEETHLRPSNPYAVSKIAQDYLGLQYFLSYKLQIVRVRPFNHIGPRQAPAFVVSRFAKQIAEIEKGTVDPVLTVGNLDARRDFTDVRDMVNAYSLIIDKGLGGEAYNIGLGKSYKIEEILNMLLSLSSAKIKVQKDPKLLRPSDTPELLCNPTKMKNITGWEPVIPLVQTLKDTLDYWRGIV